MNSINNRLTDLENKLDSNNDIISRIKKVESETKNHQIVDMMNTYVSYIMDVMDDNYNEPDYIVKLMCNTIKYVRENQTSICKVIGMKQSQDLEELTILSFVQDIVPDIYTEDMLKISIKQLIYLMYLPRDIPQIPVEPSEEKTKKKSKLNFFSSKNV